jgi:hypothetical protein
LFAGGFLQGSPMGGAGPLELEGVSWDLGVWRNVSA